MFSSDNLMFGGLITVVIAILVFAMYFTKNKSPEAMLEMDKEFPEVTKDMSEEDLKSLVNKLYSKMKDMKEEDARLRDKIKALHLEAGIQREQTKYLTASVNKSTSVL